MQICSSSIRRVRPSKKKKNHPMLVANVCLFDVAESESPSGEQKSNPKKKLFLQEIFFFRSADLSDVVPDVFVFVVVVVVGCFFCLGVPFSCQLVSSSQFLSRKEFTIYSKLLK